MKTRTRKYTDEMIKEEALKYNYVGDFKKANDAMYQAAVRRKILREVTSHMEYISYPYWTPEELLEEALKYNSRKELQTKNNAVYKAAYKRGLLDTVCAHMIESHSIPYSLDELKEEALKYKTRGEFRKNNGAAYQAASKKEEFDIICAHMEYENYPWSNEEIAEEALKFRTRSEFKLGSSAYQLALKRGLLDKVCVHMKKSSGSSRQERELFAHVKEIYPTTKKIRDLKVKIEGKPYIHGFDIDIFVPELKRGIEFDGEYHHSFKAMRADPKRKLWPDEDICNYHELKDAWFATKGIKILHIKWHEWLADKEDCIQRSLEFLRRGYEQEAA